MEISEYQNIFKNEDSHFFYISNHRIIFSLIKNFYLKNRNIKNLKILDAGCGTGLLAKKLEKLGKVWGIDTSPEALKFARKRKLNLKKGSVTNIPFPSNTFDVAVCIDVIYHRAVNDDVKGLKELFRVLKSHGILVIRVPANKWLKLIHDRHVHLRERYDKKTFMKKLKEAGFYVKKISFVNMFLLPLAILKSFVEKVKNQKNSSSAITPIPKWLNRFLISILYLEVFLLKKVNLPFGIGLIAVCQKGKINNEKT